MEYTRVADIKRLEIILKTLTANLPAGASVLDVGCGNGIISRGVGSKGFLVHGIDISEKAIERARELNTLPNVTFDVVSAEQLVADGKRYQAVICSEVLEHLHHPENLLHTLYQSLTEDGILIVTVPNGKGPREVLVTKPVINMERKRNFMWKLMTTSKKFLGYRGTTIQSVADDLTHVQFFSKKALYQLASENHFQIVKFNVTNFIDDVFPFSLLTRRSKTLQKLDASLAEHLPHVMAGSFVTVWKKKLVVSG
jgi:2-polyprenyl-3-methyl-5-hydroxy-6-metoxy-1,4-benzoquinol methylase